MKKALAAVMAVMTVAVLYGVFSAKPDHSTQFLDFVSEEQTQFLHFMQSYDRQYKDLDEYKYRLSVFAENMKTFEGLNQFADWTEGEFKALQTLQTLPQTPEVATGDYSFPASIDYRATGTVGPVKDQGACGSCWSFSTIGVLEGNERAQNYNDVLSEQQIVDCTSSPNGDNAGCNGGVVQFALEQIGGQSSKYQALLSQESMNYRTYSARQGTCDTRDGVVGVDMNTYVFMVANSDDAHKEALVTEESPISIALDATGWNRIPSGSTKIWTSEELGCSTYGQIDHAVLLVGYGAIDGVEYWLIKNSWGSNWGDAGYVKLAMKTPSGGNYSYGACSTRRQSTYVKITHS